MSVSYLSDVEIYEIAVPLTQRAAIVRWFRAHGFPDCQVRPNGMPLITRSQFDRVFAGLSPQAGQHESQSIDVNAILKRFGHGAKNKAHV